MSPRKNSFFALCIIENRKSVKKMKKVRNFSHFNIKNAVNYVFLISS